MAVCYKFKTSWKRKITARKDEMTSSKFACRCPELNTHAKKALS
jgi:hypothetical protein